MAIPPPAGRGTEILGLVAAVGCGMGTAVASWTMETDAVEGTGAAPFVIVAGDIAGANDCGLEGAAGATNRSEMGKTEGTATI